MERKICQNCKQEFRIEPEDFAFYEKSAVPTPTWCQECRMIRMTFCSFIGFEGVRKRATEIIE